MTSQCRCRASLIMRVCNCISTMHLLANMYFVVRKAWFLEIYSTNLHIWTPYTFAHVWEFADAVSLASVSNTCLAHTGLTFGVAKNVTLIAVRALDCWGQATYSDVITVRHPSCQSPCDSSFSTICMLKLTVKDFRTFMTCPIPPLLSVRAC